MQSITCLQHCDGMWWLGTRPVTLFNRIQHCLPALKHWQSHFEPPIATNRNTKLFQPSFPPLQSSTMLHPIQLVANPSKWATPLRLRLPRSKHLLAIPSMSVLVETSGVSVWVPTRGALAIGAHLGTKVAIGALLHLSWWPTLSLAGTREADFFPEVEWEQMFKFRTAFH